MIRFVIVCVKALVAAVVALLFTSCKYDVDFGNGIDGNGKVITQKREISSSFTKVISNRGVEVIIEQSDVASVEVEADENIINHITTEVKDGVLIISANENIDSAEKEEVHVKMPKIEGLECSSGSSIATKSTVRGTNITLSTDSGSTLNADLEFENVTAETDSGSSMEVSGKALSVKAVSSSGSTLDAENLVANEVTADASSGSSLSVHALVSLNGDASSGASIHYNGAPKKISKEESSGGSISAN